MLPRKVEGLRPGTADYCLLVDLFVKGVYKKHNYRADSILQQQGWQEKYNSTDFAESLRNLVATLSLQVPDRK